MNNRSKKYRARQRMLTAGLFLCTLFCGLAAADIVDEGGGNYTFDTNAPNPYTNQLVATGGTSITYNAGAQHDTGSFNALHINSAGYTVTLNNATLVHSRSGMAIYINGNFDSDIVNHGTITSANWYAVQHFLGGGTITNYGTISGGYSTSPILGVSTLVNYGTIDGHSNSNYSVIGTGGDDVFTFHAGGHVVGAISGGGGTDEIVLTGDGDDNMTDMGLLNIEIFTKSGTGTWTIPSGWGFSAGQFNVNDGTLIANSTVSIFDGVARNGATLMGTGTFNALVNNGGAHTFTFQDGATLAPGNSIGTMTINRDVVFEPGSTLEIEVNATASDVLIVDGAVTLGGTLSVIDLSGGALEGDEQYNFMSATGGYTGTFDEVVDTSATLDFTVDLNGAFLLLSSVQSRTYEDVADTPNGRHIARVLDIARGNGQLAALTDELDPLDEDGLQHAFRQLSPGASAALMRVTQHNTQRFAHDLGLHARASRAGMLGLGANDPRVPGPSLLAFASSDPQTLAWVMQENDVQDAAQPLPEKRDSNGQWNMFVSPFGQFGQIDSSADRVGYDFHAAGVILGVDYAIDDAWVVGIAGAYQYTNADYDQDMGEGDVHSLRVGPYVNWTRDAWQVDASLTGGVHWYDNDRHVNVGGIDRTASSDHEGYDISMYAKVAYAKPIGDWTLTPSASLQYLHLEQDGYTESGAGAANLTIDDSEHDSLRSVLAARLSRTIDCNGMGVTPEVWAGWARELLDDDLELAGRFVSGPASSFVTNSDGVDRNSALIGAGVTALINARTSAYLKHETELSGSSNAHTFWGGVEWRF